MPCPLFLPTSPLRDFQRGPMPLGDAYCGECAANPGSPIAPETLRNCCNFGYARCACPNATHSEADAVRFMIKRDSASTIDVAWSLEYNHHPVSVGIITFPMPEGCSTPLARQARAYLDSYLRAKGRA